MLRRAEKRSKTVDSSGLTTILIAICGLFIWLLERLSNKKGHKEIRQLLENCELSRKKDKLEHKAETTKLRIRLSGLETEMVALRNLLPGGKWYEATRTEVRGSHIEVSPKDTDTKEG